jgi:integrase
MAGSTFKRCGCRDLNSGRLLGRSCPQLRRGDRWNSKHGSWQYQVDLPPGPDGKRRTLRQGPFNSQQEADQARSHVLRLLGLPDPDDVDGREQVVQVIRRAVRMKSPLPSVEEIRRRLVTGNAVVALPTVGEWLTEWLAGRRGLRSNTYRSYESHVRLYFLPHLGSIRIDRLRVAHIDAMFTAIEERNAAIRAARASADSKVRASVKGQRIVGATSQHKIRGTLRKAINDYIRRSHGVITVNPACHVELAPARRPKPMLWTPERVTRWRQTGVIPGRVMVWTPEQTGRFLDHIAGHRLYSLYRVIAYRGLRRGEACGIHDDDINADALGLTIRTQRVQIGWDVQDGEPKTDAGERNVALDRGTLHALLARQAVRDAERAIAGDAWVDQTGLLYTEPDGTPIHPATVTDTFNTLVAEADLPPIRLHDLRHGAATLALAAGVDLKVVQDMLGHSSLAITADTYTSVLTELAHQAADAIAARIPRTTANSHNNH